MLVKGSWKDFSSVVDSQLLFLKGGDTFQALAFNSVPFLIASLLSSQAEGLDPQPSKQGCRP